MRYWPILLLAACSWSSTTDSWNGHPLDELVYSWGAPTTSAQLDDGRQVVTFSRSNDILGISYYCNVTFRVAPDGIIQSNSIDGNIGGCNRMLD